MLATTMLSDRLALDVQGAQALRAGAREGDAETLRAAAKQFEAMVVGMMLKNMRQTSLAGEGDVLGESQSMKLYRDMMDQQWAQKIASGKGFGFADMMVKAMESRTKAMSAEDAASLALPAGEAKAYPLTVERAANVPAAPIALPTQAAPVAQAMVERSANPGVAAQPATGDHRQRFIDQLRPHAEQIEAETGIPARFVLAHAALETGWGRYAIRNADGSDSHNLFGIKAGRGWSGQVAAQETTEYQHGLAVRKTESFRAYGDYTEALRDYAGLLGKRYQAAYNAGEDAGNFAQGLAEGGYATDPNYAGKLKGVIASVAALGA
jgi:flagellar protein FlgJ